MDAKIPARRAGLARRTVVDTALTLLNEVGLDGLTVRRLAAELGVKSPALYWHFSNKRELLDQMSQAIQLSQDMSGPRGNESWQDWVARRACERRELLLSYRDGARLLAGSEAGPPVFAMFERELAVLVDHGFEPAEAFRAIASIGHYVTGFVLEEQAEHQRYADATHDHADVAGLAALAHDAPFLAAAFRDGGDPQSDAAFAYGLQLLIDGMAVALERSSAGLAHSPGRQPD